MGVLAEFDSRCDVCDGEIIEGEDVIEYSEAAGAWVHADCWEEAEDV